MLKRSFDIDINVCNVYDHVKCIRIMLNNNERLSLTEVMKENRNIKNCDWMLKKFQEIQSFEEKF